MDGYLHRSIQYESIYSIQFFMAVLVTICGRLDFTWISASSLRKIIKCRNRPFILKLNLKRAFLWQTLMIVNVHVIVHVNVHHECSRECLYVVLYNTVQFCSMFLKLQMKGHHFNVWNSFRKHGKLFYYNRAYTVVTNCNTGEQSASRFLSMRTNMW